MASIFTTTARAKGLLRIPTAVTLYDEAIGLLVDDVDGLLAGEAGLPSLATASYLDTLDVDWAGCRDLPLSAWPVQSVAGVTDDGSAVSADDYAFDARAGYLRLTGVGNYWTQGRQKVNVRYTAGLTYTDRLWPTFRSAATEQVAWEWNRGARAGLASASAADVSTTLVATLDPLCPSARRAIGSLQRMFV